MEDELRKALGGRPPHGGRGLKSGKTLLAKAVAGSPPTRGAWIEIVTCLAYGNGYFASPPTRGAWIEI